MSDFIHRNNRGQLVSSNRLRFAVLGLVVLIIGLLWMYPASENPGIVVGFLALLVGAVISIAAEPDDHECYNGDDTE